MTQEELDAMVNRLERLAHQQPALYKFRVGILAALGYIYICLVLVLLLAIVAALVKVVISGYFNRWIVYLGVMVLLVAFIIVRSLWVTIPPPSGIKLQHKQAPQLFTLVKELISALQAPKFHHILLTNEFNAAVVQRPRLGVLGWQQNYLLLGLPLMHALSPEQFRAVVAHELGHLSGKHSRFAGWIYRVRKTWFNLLEHFEAGRQTAPDNIQLAAAVCGTIIFEPFFNWYTPFFGAYSFVLARANEYEADRCAVELAGAKNMAEALINVEVKAQFLENAFWPSVYKQSEVQPEPPTDTFKTMFGALRDQIATDDSQNWLQQALAQKTNNVDTHPCLRDRLSALGYCPSQQRETLPLPISIKVTAAQQFLGVREPLFTSRLDHDWRDEIAPSWQQQFSYVQESKQRLQTLEQKVQNQPLTTEESWHQAQLTAEFKGHEAAIPLLLNILSVQPNHLAANSLLGQILLACNDAEGIRYIEKVMEQDANSIIPGCQLIYRFLKQHGRTEEAQQYWDRVKRIHQL